MPPWNPTGGAYDEQRNLPITGAQATKVREVGIPHAGIPLLRLRRWLRLRAQRLVRQQQILPRQLQRRQGAGGVAVAPRAGGKQMGSELLTLLPASLLPAPVMTSDLLPAP